MSTGEKLSFWLNEKKLSVQVCALRVRKNPRVAGGIARDNATSFPMMMRC